MDIQSYKADKLYRNTKLSHPFFAWLGLRPIFAQHTLAEHQAIGKAASMRRTIVEIGVAEGASAIALCETMAPDARLFLIDPYHLSRIRFLNTLRRAAHRAVRQCHRGTVIWMERFSNDVAFSWNEPIDLLLIDGDHAEPAVWRDWNDWSKFVQPGGLVVFHDARLFEGGWTKPEDGPVRVVDALFRNAQQPGWLIVREIDSVVVVQKQS
ncbi:MAG: class I SAM-dependent methyltransferase [Acidobacteriia bacterium]|nr:class I SAM-dependent methyltransferase [Terriglobia bacterium]